MTTVQLSIYAMAIGLCVFTGALAWRSLFYSRAFLMFLGVITTMLICDWLMAHPATPLKSLWLIGLMAGSFIVSPCVLWLAKSTGLSTHPLAVRRHAALAVIGWLLLIPLATAIHWGTGFAKPGNPTSAEYAFFIHTTMLISVALFFGQTCLALRTCVAYLRERSRQNDALFSACDDPGLNTLRLLVLVLIANAAIAMTRVLYCALFDGVVFSLSLAIVLGQLAMVVFLAIAFMHQQVVSLRSQSEALREHLFQPIDAGYLANRGDLLDSFNVARDRACDSVKAPTLAGLTKYSKSSLSSERQAQIMTAMTQAMDEGQLFTQPGLSLNDVCEHINESAHHVSQAISQSEHHNFYDLINRHRVARAARLLCEQPASTVLDIGFACGFNSKSSFNSLFKKYQGLTPSQYRTQQQQSPTMPPPLANTP